MKSEFVSAPTAHGWSIRLYRIAAPAFGTVVISLGALCFAQSTDLAEVHRAVSSTTTVNYSKAYTGTEVLQAGEAPFSATMPTNAVALNAAPYNTRIARLTDTDTIPNGQAFTVPGGGGSDGVVTTRREIWLPWSRWAARLTCSATTASRCRCGR